MKIKSHEKVVASFPLVGTVTREAMVSLFCQFYVRKPLRLLTKMRKLYCRHAAELNDKYTNANKEATRSEVANGVSV